MPLAATQRPGPQRSGVIWLATHPTAPLTIYETGVIHWKLSGSSPVSMSQKPTRIAAALP